MCAKMKCALFFNHCIDIDWSLAIYLCTYIIKWKDKCVIFSSLNNADNVIFLHPRLSNHVY